MKTVPPVALCPAAAPRRTGENPFLRWAGVLAVLRPPVRRRRVLDVRTLSDHLKRDIGALDGNDPRGPRP